MSRHLLLVPGLCAGILVGAAVVPAALAAQSLGSLATSDARSSRASYDVTSVPQTPRGVPDSAATAVIGPIATPVAAHSQTAPARFVAPDQHVGAGSDLALAIVGGAGLIVGLLIGGKGGDAIAIGGGLVGLYGLYQYLK
jgi:hypothetical protein